MRLERIVEIPLVLERTMWMGHTRTGPEQTNIGLIGANHAELVGEDPTSLYNNRREDSLMVE